MRKIPSCINYIVDVTKNLLKREENFHTFILSERKISNVTCDNE